MAITDEIVKFSVKAQGTEVLARLRAEYDAIVSLIAETSDAYQKGSLSTQEYTANTRYLATEQDRLATIFERAEKQAARETARAEAEAKRAAQRLASAQAEAERKQAILAQEQAAQEKAEQKEAARAARREAREAARAARQQAILAQEQAAQEKAEQREAAREARRQAREAERSARKQAILAQEQAAQEKAEQKEAKIAERNAARDAAANARKQAILAQEQAAQAKAAVQAELFANVKSKEAAIITLLSIEYGQNNAKLAQLNEQLAKGSITASAYMQATAGINTQQQILKKDIDALEVALGRKTAATTKATAANAAMSREGDRAARTSSMMGLGFLELSRAVEDAQYGLRGVLNNIPTMVMLFGGSGGLAAAVSIAAVALSQLYENWEKISKSFGAADTLTSHLERMKAFRDVLEGTIAKTKELEEAEAKRYEKSEAQKSSETLSKAAIGTIGEKQATEGVSKTLGEQLLDESGFYKQIDAIEKAIGDQEAFAAQTRIPQVRAEEFAKLEGMKKSLKDMRDTEFVRREVLSREFLGTASTDAGARKRLLGAMEGDIGAFGTGAEQMFIGLQAADPEFQKAQKKSERDVKDQEAEAKRKKDAAKKKLDADKAFEEIDEKIEEEEGKRAVNETKRREELQKQVRLGRARQGVAQTFGRLGMNPALADAISGGVAEDLLAQAPGGFRNQAELEQAMLKATQKRMLDLQSETMKTVGGIAGNQQAAASQVALIESQLAALQNLVNQSRVRRPTFRPRPW